MLGNVRKQSVLFEQFLDEITAYYRAVINLLFEFEILQLCSIYKRKNEENNIVCKFLTFKASCSTSKVFPCSQIPSYKIVVRHFEFIMETEKLLQHLGLGTTYSVVKETN